MPKEFDTLEEALCAAIASLIEGDELTGDIADLLGDAGVSLDMVEMDADEFADLLDDVAREAA